MKNTKKVKRLRPSTKRMINGEEGTDVEYKRSISGLKSDDFISFANAKGGTIIIGVEESKKPNGSQCGEIVGCKISDESKNKINSIAKDCRPPVIVEINTEYYRKKGIYRIDIKSASRKPVCTSGGTYKIRKSGANVLIDPDLMFSLILEREEQEFIKKFNEAGQDILDRIEASEKRLQELIKRVEVTAEDAFRAAQYAAEQAGDAVIAAEDAAGMVEDPDVASEKGPS